MTLVVSLLSPRFADGPPERWTSDGTLVSEQLAASERADCTVAAGAQGPLDRDDPSIPAPASGPYDKARANEWLGTVLRGKYRLDALLGAGGTASVFSATHVRNSSRVAIKLMHPWLAIDEEQRSRFVEEGRAANEVKHPGVVRVFDDDVTADGVPFLVMELLHGETLGERWRRTKRHMVWDEVARGVSALLAVLAAAHAMGIVHCDVKPDNIFLTREGSVKLLDFGIARVRDVGSAAASVRGISGTPAYMSPEQASGLWSEMDARSDVWAVGALAFALLSGHPVHGAGSVQEMVLRAATAAAPSVASVAPKVPLAMARIIDRALEHDKKHRWPNAGAMKVALDRLCVRGTSSPARRRRAIEHSRGDMNAAVRRTRPEFAPSHCVARVG